MAGRPRSKLSEEAQTFVVTSLAMYDTPGQVAEAVKKEFGVEVTPQAIETYDPTKRAGAKLSKRWSTLFHETREGFVKDTSSVAISHRVVRIRALQRMAEKAEKQGNIVVAAQLLEQAAKEMGDAYTNTRVLRGGLELTAPKSLADFYGGQNT